MPILMSQQQDPLRPCVIDWAPSRGQHEGVEQHCGNSRQTTLFFPIRGHGDNQVLAFLASRDRATLRRPRSL